MTKMENVFYYFVRCFLGTIFKKVYRREFTTRSNFLNFSDYLHDNGRDLCMRAKGRRISCWWILGIFKCYSWCRWQRKLNQNNPSIIMSSSALNSHDWLVSHYLFHRTWSMEKRVLANWTVVSKTSWIRMNTIWPLCNVWSMCGYEYRYWAKFHFLCGWPAPVIPSAINPYLHVSIIWTLNASLN